MGTYGYAAPEYVLTGKKHLFGLLSKEVFARRLRLSMFELCFSGHLNSKSDIYSFGVVLFEALCGKPPLLRDRGGANNKIPIADWVLILSNDN